MHYNKLVSHDITDHTNAAEPAVIYTAIRKNLGIYGLYTRSRR